MAESRLSAAHHEWAQRPNDERFATLDVLGEHVANVRKHAAEFEMPRWRLEVVVDAGELCLRGSQVNPRLTRWSAQQLCGLAGASTYLLDEELRPETVAQALNEKLAARRGQPENERGAFGDRPAAVLLDMGGGDRPPKLRAFTSTKFARVWDEEVVEFARGLKRYGDWTVPPAMTDHQKPSGLYAGDRDMFVFLVDESARVRDGSPRGLARGFFLWNSEVGARELGGTTFLYDYICGNHYVWGATAVRRFGRRHVGRAEDVRAQGLGDLLAVVREWASSSAEEDEARICLAQETPLGVTDDEVLKACVRLVPKASMSLLRAGLAASKVSVSSPATRPYSVWGMVDGITQASQQLFSQWTDMWVEADEVAQQVLVRALA